MTATDDHIQLQGIYTIQQAARLARVRTQMISRWLDGEDGVGAIARNMPESESRVVSFVDFIQTMAVRSIRQDPIHRVSLQKIRATVEAAARHGVHFPFARKHTTYLFEDDVVIRTAKDELIQTTGKYRKHQLINQVVELYLEDLGFDDDGLANIYIPSRMKDGDRQIVINPAVQFGAPCVMPSGYTVGALIDAVAGEGSVEAAANAYDVDAREVRLALAYDDSLSGAVA